MIQDDLPLDLARKSPQDGSERLRLRDCAGPGCGNSFSVNPHSPVEHRFCCDPCRKAWHKAQQDKPQTRAERILARLRQGPSTGLDLLRAGGGTRYGARILELRHQGHHIETDMSGEWPVYWLEE